MFLILSVFLGLICNGELAPTSVSDSSSSSTSHVKRKSQDIGSLSDFTWQAWIVMDPQAAAQSGMESATLLRKITPKSVFIAPALLPCPEGYKTDSMNRCVKNAFNLDEDAHISFLLQRLNTMYANQDSVGNKSNEQKKSTGPLQLNIPLLPNPLAQIDHEEIMMSDSISVPTRNQTQPEDEEKTKSHAEVVYEVKNNTTLDEKKTTIFLQNSSTPHVGKTEKTDTVIVTEELIDDTNDTDFTEMLREPVFEPLFEASSVERLDENDATKEAMKNVSTLDKAENSTKTSTSVALLLSSTKLPSVNDSLSTQNDSAHLFTQTTKEIIIRVPDPTLSTKETTKIPPIAEDEQRDNETYNEATPTNWKLNESQEIFYEDAEYSSGNTNEPNEEKSLEVEDGEILKAGEAGMMIPTQNVERLRYDQQQQQQQNQTTEQKETVDTRDQIVIRFNDSTPTNDKDEEDSNVSSEVSINGDLILETTLLDVSTERLQVTTKSPVVISKIVTNDDNSKETFDRNFGSSKVVFPQDSHSAMSTNSYGHKQGENVAQIENDRTEELQAAASSPQSLLFDPPDPITEAAKEETDSKESVLRESPRDPESDVYSASFFKQMTANLASEGNLVRFPDARQPAQRNSYVRFPSNEANSIHSSSYKYHYPADDHGAIYGSDGSSMKSSVPVFQKPVYYLSASPNWKPNRNDRASATAGERQKQSTGLLGFWSNMPLIQDPAMYPFDQSTDRLSFQASRETASTVDVDKAYTQKQRRTAIVA